MSYILDATGNPTNGYLPSGFIPANSPYVPYGWRFENFSRFNTLQNLAALTSGQPYLTALWLPQGVNITQLGFVTGTTAAATVTNSWMSLCDYNRYTIVTSPTSTTAVAANTLVTFPFARTTIAAGSNGQNLAQATITVASTTGFPTAGQILVWTTSGQQTITYTGIGATTFTGCTGGTGTLLTGATVNQVIPTAYSGLYYAAIMYQATTAPSLQGVSTTTTTVQAVGPILAGNSATTAQTTPPAANTQFGAITQAASLPYLLAA